ncbi:MAG: integral rane sensor signal transduction histidine kinase [Frankiales bacterium]|nr:integral rane sensor signal transduction histidine kinase [Frankiales bacterium]
MALRRTGAQAGPVTAQPLSDALSRRADALRDWLPTGRALSERDFAWRHRAVCLALAAHLPVLLVLASLRVSLLHGLAETAGVGLLLGLSRGPVSRRTAALSATIGLLSCSALLVHLYDGRTELHFHYFAAVALVALYQDWRVFATAIGFVAVQHAVVGALSPSSLTSDGESAWVVAVVHAGFVLAEAVVLVVFWHANEQARTGEEGLQRALWEGQSSVRERMLETDRIRTDLLATVSHEFRTPLTGIRGAALTLLKRGDRLDPAARDRLLQAVLDQQERLSRLLENMLTAAQVTTADASATAEVLGVAAEVAMLAGAEHPGRPGVSVLVDAGAVARIDRQALHQVLANLVDNAIVHGAPGSVPLITGGRDERGIWVAVSNDGSAMDVDRASRLFEPFSQADTSATRRTEGLGMGLYVVRRLVEVYGGEVEVRSDDGWVTVEVRLAAVPEVVLEASDPVRVPQPVWS